MSRLVLMATLLLAGAGCTGGARGQSDAGPDAASDGRVASCGPGLKPHGPACIPIFDECGEDEVPLLGGGCRKVGVEECQPPGGVHGIKAPPDWSCKPIGPPTACLAGWAKTTDGWCEPVLPSQPCGPNTMEVIGKSDCQPVGDCGTGTWGKIATTASTIFVDEGAAGPAGDGSQAKPYVTISAAVKAASAGAHLAIAGGTYAGSVTIDKPLILEGRCAKLVKITGPAGELYAVGIAAKGVELRGVTVSGSKVGIGIGVGGQALVERVVVQGCETAGIHGYKAQLTLRDVLVDRTGASMGNGVLAMGGTLVIERSAIRDASAAGDTKYQDADVAVTSVDDVRTRNGTWKGTPGTATLRDSVVAGSRDRGVLAQGSTVYLERCAVLDAGGPADFGAVDVSGWTGPARAELRDCLLARNRFAGVLLNGGNGILERTIVRDTLPATSGNVAGLGVAVAGWGKTLLEGQVLLEVRDSLLLRNAGAALFLGGASVTLERSVVRDTLGTDRGDNAAIADGINQDNLLPGALIVRDSLVAQNRSLGLSLGSALAILERTIIRDTRPDLAGLDGIGVGAWPAQLLAGRLGPAGSLMMRDCRVAGNRVKGVYLDTTAATIERTVVCDTQPGRTIVSADGAVEDGVFGDGITAFEQQLVLRHSVVARNHYTGIGMFCTSGTIERSVVRNTLQLDSVLSSSLLAGQGGTAIAVASLSDCGSADLVVHASLVEDSEGSGIYVAGATVAVEQSRIRRTPAATFDGEPVWGDGLTVSVVPHGQVVDPASLAVSDSLVEASARAGLIFYGGRGSVRRSVFRGGALAVDLEEAATPEIGDDNVYEGNLEDRVTWGNKIAPTPAPQVPSLQPPKP